MTAQSLSEQNVLSVKRIVWENIVAVKQITPTQNCFQATVSHVKHKNKVTYTASCVQKQKQHMSKHK